MRKLKERYRKLSQYINTDLWMYLTMILIIAAGVVYILVTD